MSEPQRIFKQLLKPNNKFCADCKKTDPRWFSSKHGVFLCEQCAEIHKSIFPKDAKKIKSLDELKFDLNDAIQLESLGNKKMNDYYEYYMNSNSRQDGTNKRRMIDFINDKYVIHRWANKRKKPKKSHLFKVLNESITFLGYLFIFAITLPITLLFLRLKFKNLQEYTKSISLGIIILMEILGINDKTYKIIDYFNPVFVEQILLGMAGIGFIDGFIYAIIVKLIRIFLDLKFFRIDMREFGIIPFCAVILLVFIRFGLKMLIISSIYATFIFFYFKLFILKIYDSKVEFGEKFLE